MRRNGIQLDEIEVEHILELMNIYLSEWKHRDEVLWKQTFKYFYVTLFVLFLPNIAHSVTIDFPNLPKIIFPIAAIPLSIMFLYVSLGCCKRTEALTKTFVKIMKQLPEDLQRLPQDDPSIRFGKFFNVRMSFIICLLMFSVLLFLSIVMIVYYSCVLQ